MPRKIIILVLPRPSIENIGMADRMAFPHPNKAGGDLKASPRFINTLFLQAS